MKLLLLLIQDEPAHAHDRHRNDAHDEGDQLVPNGNPIARDVDPPVGDTRNPRGQPVDFFAHPGEGLLECRARFLPRFARAPRTRQGPDFGG